MRLRSLCVFACCALAVACGKKDFDTTKEAPEYYLFSAYDAASGEWLILHVDKVQNTKIEIRAICDYYQLPKREMIRGPKSCDMRVGEKIEPNPLRNRPGDFVAVWTTSSELLQFEIGSGSDHVSQGFRILSARVVP